MRYFCFNCVCSFAKKSFSLICINFICTSLNEIKIKNNMPSPFPCVSLSMTCANVMQIFKSFYFYAAVSLFRQNIFFFKRLICILRHFLSSIHYTLQTINNCVKFRYWFLFMFLFLIVEYWKMFVAKMKGVWACCYKKLKFN